MKNDAGWRRYVAAMYPVACSGGILFDDFYQAVTVWKHWRQLSFALNFRYDTA